MEKMYTTINEFKKTLMINEQTTTENIQIIVKNAEYRKTKDSYTEGETEQVDAGELHFSDRFSSVENFIQEANDILAFDISKDNMFMVDDRIIIDKLVDDNNNELVIDSDNYNEWKAGELDGFSFHVDIIIQLNKIESITDSNEVSKILGIENYN